MTIAIDARGRFEEKELGRDLKALQWEGANYARIEKEAAVTLVNNKKIELDVEITLRVGGKATRTTRRRGARSDIGQSSLLETLAAMPSSRRFLPIFFGSRRKPAIGLEPITPALQERCSTN